MSQWHTLEPGQRDDIVTRARRRLATFHFAVPDKLEDVCEAVVNALDDTVGDRAYAEGHEDGYALGHDDGLEMGSNRGYDQAIAEVKALAEEVA